MKTFLTVLCLLGFSNALAAEPDINVYAAVCGGSKVENGNNVSTMRWLIGGAESAANEKATLQIKTQLFTVDGVERVKVTAKALSAETGAYAAAMASVDVGASLVVRAGASCETADDIDKLSLSISIRPKKADRPQH